MGKSSKGELTVPSLSGKNIIALDIGRRTGWCVYCDDIERHKDSGVFELYSEKNVDYTDGDRFRALSRFLVALIDIVKPGVIVYEQVNGGTKGRQTQLYNGYRAVLLELACRLEIPVIPLTVQRIKIVVSGRGDASKEDVERAVVELGHAPFDDNEADAIAALYTAIRLSKDGELEQAVREAKPIDLAQFKTPAKAKKGKKSLTLVYDSSNVVSRKTNETAIGAAKAKKTCEVPLRQPRVRGPHKRLRVNSWCSRHGSRGNP